MKQVRCAVYTRKSSEEGLELDFNSLDAQREACEAYIKSQKHEGWTLVTKQYNDGGFSGGTIERPAFKELLEDIKQNKIDIVVVYKVDRLTRSLMDFAKIIEIFDAHQASFVSITQQFNTTTSMGRLTLNMLLSFAQFEREITSERLRDKFEASRKKGLFVHGKAPIGYTKVGSTLVENPEQSGFVRLIFDKYLELGSIKNLHDYLIENDIKTESGKNFRKGHLNHLLKNKVYIGKIVHKDKVYEGLHEGIIDEDVFEKVQKMFRENSIERKYETNNPSYALLASKLFDDKGNYMSPSYSNNRYKKRYCYYISQAILQNREQDVGTISKLPKLEIETLVRKVITEFVRNKTEIQQYIANKSIALQKKSLDMVVDIELNDQIIRYVLNKVIVHKNEVEVVLNQNILVKVLELLAYGERVLIDFADDEFITITMPVQLVAVPKRGNKLIIENECQYNLTLIQSVAKGFYYHKLWFEGKLSKEQKSSYIYRLMSLRYLPPKLIEDILNGKQAPDMTVKELYRIAGRSV